MYRGVWFRTRVYASSLAPDSYPNFTFSCFGTSPLYFVKCKLAQKQLMVQQNLILQLVEKFLAIAM